MQVVIKVLGTLLAVWLALLAFMPKEEIYFRAEQELAAKGVEINEAQMEEGLFGLEIKDAEVYVEGIKVATVKGISFFTLLFYTEVEADGVQTDASLQSMAPASISHIVITHSILHPQTFYIEAEGSFGKAEGTLSLATHTLHLDLVETGRIDTVKNLLKQGGEGWYYESTF